MGMNETNFGKAVDESISYITIGANNFVCPLKIYVNILKK